MESKKKAKANPVKIKIDALAKELGQDIKHVLSVLKDLNIPAKTKASSIDVESAKIVTELIKGKETPPPPKAKEEINKVPVEPKEEKSAPKKEPEKEPAEVPIQKETAAKPAPKVITISSGEITLKDLAVKMNAKPSDLIKELMMEGILATINQRIDFEIAKKITSKFGFEIEEEKKLKIELPQAKEGKKSPLDQKDLKLRPPVVTIMGHVDHGKTKLLDAIRKTNVIDTEAGGITQHIGAYQVEEKGKLITFLDTPGHEAFTALRARGANVTDIVILVVAADDGVMPQTIEAIDHAKASGAPIIVAINKIDKEGANQDRVKQQLSELGLSPEDWGGQTVTVPISAKQLVGIDTLLDMILLVSELLELKANPSATAAAIVIESTLDKNMGPIANVLVQNGTLRVGDSFYSGTTSGRIRALINDKGKRISKAPPATPVEIIGIADVPKAGDILHVVKNEKEARVFALKNKDESSSQAAQGKLMSLEDISQKINAGETKTLNLIIKGDAQGSVEAIKKSIENISSDNIKTHIVRATTGNITRSDVMLAKASEAIIIGFGVDFDSDTLSFAEAEGIDARLYKIIYEVIDDIKLALEGMLKPEYEEVVIGHAKVRQTFKFSKVGTIAGTIVIDGIMKRGLSIRILRENEKMFEGKLISLKRFKDDVKEVASGLECGIVIDNFADFKGDDIIEQYEMRLKKKHVKA